MSLNKSLGEKMVKLLNCVEELEPYLTWLVVSTQLKKIVKLGIFPN